METAAVESISKALGLPRPFLNESNRAFKQLETWQQLTALVATQRVDLKPLGYYRTPESIDIYVFECSMKDLSSARCYSWKIYRRYRHFKNYIAHSSELGVTASVRVPRLASAVFPIFHAQHSKDRLVELHKWLEEVVEKTRSYCEKLHEKREVWEHDKLVDFRQQRLTQLELQAKHEAPRKQKSQSSTDVASATTINRRDRLQRSMIKTLTTGSQRRRNSFNIRTIEQQRDPRLNVRRSDKVETLPVILLSSFLFAGANCPYPHVFRTLPGFALASHELNVHITQRVFPSKLRNSTTTKTGLGLRLMPSHEQDGEYFGATVAKLLRKPNELNPALVDVSVGAQLVQINGIDISMMPFDQILVQLRSARGSLRLKFSSIPQINRHRGAVTLLSTSENITNIPSEKQHVMSSGSIDTLVAEPPLIHRSVSVDTPRHSSGLLTAMLRDLFGTRGGSQGTTARETTCTELPTALGKQRGTSIDITWESLQLLHPNPTTFDSWDALNGAFRDLISRGFYSDVTSLLLSKRSATYHAMKKESLFLSKSDRTDHDDTQKSRERKNRAARESHGVWSTATGPMGLAFGASKVCGIDAVILAHAPVFFSSRAERRGSEKRLCRGFVLTAVNSKSTFGASIATVFERLHSAGRPTTLCFRWYDEYSPSLRQRVKAFDIEHSPRDLIVDNGLDWMAEAQTELSNTLQLALVENATVRDELSVLQDAHRELRLAHERAAQREHILQVAIEQCNLKVAKLTADGDSVRRDLDQSQRRMQEAEATMTVNMKEYDARMRQAQEIAMTRLAEHQEQLVNESNRSIETANRLAETRAQKRLEMAVTECERKHNEYLQKLAEEHSEEVESLMQQVAVWRHQVEVLTEAEKRNYAALVSTGVHPYSTNPRSRFGYMSSESPIADLKTHDLEGSQRKQAKKRDASVASNTAIKWRSGNDSVANTHDANDQSTAVNNRTFWDRMVSLLG